MFAASGVRRAWSDERTGVATLPGSWKMSSSFSAPSSKREIAPTWMPMVVFAALVSAFTSPARAGGGQKFTPRILRHEAVRPLTNEPSLERNPGVHLHDPRSDSIRELTKPRVIHAGYQPVEVRMVESIKHVGPDLQFNAFAEREIPGNTEV